ncbi:hypothetical protein VK70_17360 [Paenibacillus durus ATCC 35681]|uniref:Uncharacterized protein n=1 Tax=Paenibacillus durus ATCC 35681 TaxID=1333534 RepID=A0A0F7FBK9_PAEDU|nr:hypothetical protein VK70_17360 [Paenibacillus durus ATCC 35681]
MVLSSFVTKSVKILSKERSAFAADAERTPFFKVCAFRQNRHFFVQKRTYIIQSRSFMDGFFYFLLGELFLKQQQQRFKDPPRQPIRCKGCYWGEWTGTKQFCSKQKCQKEKPS